MPGDVDDEDEEDYRPYKMSIEECAKKGHCYCWQERGAPHCCWCGHFDYERKKRNNLNWFRGKVREYLEKYPDEVRDIIKEEVL